MYQKKKNKKYIILIILILVTLLLVFLFSIIKSNRNLTIVEKMMKDSFIGIEKIIYKPFGYLKEKSVQSQEKNDLYIKYKNQQQELANIDSLKAKQAELEQQLREMKKLENIDKTSLEYEYLNATVVNRNVGYWYNTLTIDKGKNNGVKKNMVVINSDGLIGKITKVSNFTSTVKLLTNSDNTTPLSVKIKVNDNYAFGILKSYNRKNGHLIVEGISGNNQIPIGSDVVTTGLSDNSPSGILIGKVVNIKTDNFDLERIVEVESKVNFDNINYVSILKHKDSK